MTHAAHGQPLEFHDIDEVAELLRRSGGRFSAARRLVLEALFAAEGPVSAEQIARGGGGRSAPVDLTSAYRILERLEELGVVRHVHFGHGPGRYALTRDGTREYLVCERCDRVAEVEPAQLDAVRKLLERDFGFAASFTHFPIVGLCAECAAAP
jgi:Fur family ferric uptake transcriptional regulator